MRRLVWLLAGFVLGAGAVIVYLVASARPVAPRPVPADPPVMVTLGAPFLTAVMHQAIAHSPQAAMISDLRVVPREGELELTANVAVLGYATRATVELRPVVRAGTLAVEVVAGEVGNLPVPIESMLQDELDRRMRALWTDVPFTVTAVAVRPDRGLMISGRVDVGALVDASDAGAGRTPRTAP